MNTLDIREHFIKYFRSNMHKMLKPSKVFTNDPTLFFTTAGMVQLKPKFLGLEEYDEKYSRLVNCQPCIRAGGKHNDLDDVGFDTYHLTSFNMLGNWSLNQYWKDDAIELAFNYLISLGLDPNRMYATYFEGNENIPEDIESKNIWLRYLPESHVLKGSTKDNFWSLGSGPCGPCTEIHYDIIDGRGNVSNAVNGDDATVVEVWNIVLMEYNEIVSTIDTRYELLTKRFVDTGAGLERLAMIVQGVNSVYQTDVFKKLIKYVEIMSGKEYCDTYKVIDMTNSHAMRQKGIDESIRIFADHMRTLVIALFDGAIFDSHNRGFIMRKILRRMLLNYYINLNNCIVDSVMSHHIISAMITEILNFYLFYKHDANQIKQMLIEEEKMYIGQINKFKLMYNSEVKKHKTDEQAHKNILCNNVALYESQGVSMQLIMCIDRIVVNLVH